MMGEKSGFAHKIVRWPVLLIVGVSILLELILYIFIRWIIVAIEYTFTWRRTLRGIRSQMLLAKDYKSWKDIAAKMDQVAGKDEWKMSTDSPLYDQTLISNMLQQLQRHTKAVVDSANEKSSDDFTKNIAKLMSTLEVATKSNFGGIENERLYSHSYLGTKFLVHQFYDQLHQNLSLVYRSNLPSKEKISFFKRLCKDYGRTALCLSGGASFGFYHLGVIQCLLERNLLPKVITGTSAGALMAAFACIRTDDELRQLINPQLAKHMKTSSDTMFQKIKRMLKEGVIFDLDQWISNIQWMTMGATTFMEAYKRTGRILNISAVPTERHSPPKLLNYRNTPNVVIYSAVIASASAPGLVKPTELLYKAEDGTLQPYHNIGAKWRDGSLKTDIPTTTLHSLFNVNYTIVSQVNPHIFPFFFNNRGSSGSPSPHRKGHGWRGGFILTTFERLLKLDMIKWLRFLRDLDILPPILGQDWSFLFLQKFEGTVTITPRLNFRDYFRILSDADEKELPRYILGGQRMTWPKLGMIENRMKIEQALHEFKTKLIAQENKN